MVDGQLRTSGITDWRILAIMDEVPREKFVPDLRRDLSYLDEPIPVSPSRLMLNPAAFSKLVQLARVTNDDVVLDIACGTGYSTAVLAGLGNAVVALEDDEALVSQANDLLAALDIGNAAVVEGALTAGVPKEAPFDIIIIEGAVDAVPQALFDQLRDGGRLVAVVGRGGAAVTHLYVKDKSQVLPRATFNLSVPPLEAFSRHESFEF